jgi:hypothetical protein
LLIENWGPMVPFFVFGRWFLSFAGPMAGLEGL